MPEVFPMVQWKYLQENFRLTNSKVSGDRRAAGQILIDRRLKKMLDTIRKLPGWNKSLTGLGDTLYAAGVSPR